MGGKRLRRDAVDAEAARIWGALTRVVALTPEAVAERPVHVVTLKLDGQRAALACKAGSLSRIDALGRRVLARDLACRDFVLDVEERAGVFWAFDALLVEARDVRGLPLQDRLELAGRLCEALRLPAPLQLQFKRYHSLRTPGILRRLLAEIAADEDLHDGLIFCDLSAPYEQPALKFKRAPSVDFCLESRGHQDGFLLLTEQAARLRPFCVRGAPVRLSLSREDRVSLELPERIDAADGCVVECEPPRGPQGRWRIKRRRADRRRPNCLQTVLDTLALRSRGLHDGATLLRVVPALCTRAAVQVWRQVLRRRVLATERVSGGVEVGAGPGQAVPLEELSLPPAGDVSVLAFFVGEAELLRLLAVLRHWRTSGGGRQRRARLLAVLQLAPPAGCLADVEWFGATVGPPEPLRARVAEALGCRCSLAPLPEAQASPLLALPPLLQELGAHVRLLRSQAAAGAVEDG